MFTRDEMLVPVGLAEEKIREKGNEFEEKLEKMKEEHVGIVNQMKEYARQRGHAVIRSLKFSIGKPTPFFDREGYRLYTGDEVAFRSGKLGIVTRGIEGGHPESDTPYYMIYTNKETAELVTEAKYEEMTRAFMMFEGVVKGEFLTITRHFNTLSDGDEIAKGRQGAEGFVVDLKEI
jgi:hypothetical protein